MVLSQLWWLGTCTHKDKTQTPHHLLSEDSAYQKMNTRGHISSKDLGGFWVVLDERLRTGSSLPLRSTASSTVSALLTVRLQASPLLALPLFLQVT